MRIYVIKKGNKDVCLVKALTQSQAINIYTRSAKIELQAVCISADKVWSYAVEQNLPMLEPDNATEPKPLPSKTEEATDPVVHRIFELNGQA